MYNIQFQLFYKNQNGLQKFSGASYRILKSDKKTVLIEANQTDESGKTKSIKLKNDEVVYIQLFNKNKGIYESPSKDLSDWSYRCKAKSEIKEVLVSNTYFQIRLSDADWKNINGWKYVITFGKLKVKGIIASGRSIYLSSSEIDLIDNKKESMYINEYRRISISSSPLVTVTVIDPINKREYTKNERVIPVGAKHAYRDFNIKRKLSQLEDASKNSTVTLKSQVDYKPMMISIKEKSGALYEVYLENNEVFYDSSWGRIRKHKIQDGKAEQLFIPYNYKGFVFIKYNGKLIKKIPAVKDSSSPYAGPIVYGNRSFGKYKFEPKNMPNSLSYNPVFRTSNDYTLFNKGVFNKNVNDSVIIDYCFQIENCNLKDGYYDYDTISAISDADFRALMYNLFSNILFDGLGLPTLIYTLEHGLNTNSRKMLMDTIIIPIFKTKQSLRFYIKTNKKGTKILVFKGYSGLRKYLNMTHITLNNKRVTMLSGMAEIAYDYKTISKTSPLTATIKTGANVIKTGAKGSIFGLCFVVAFDVLEWLAEDNDDKRVTDLLGQIGIDIIKSVGAGILGVAAGVAVGIIGGSALAVIAAGAVVMVVASYVLEKLDVKFNWAKNIKNFTTESYDWLVEETENLWDSLNNTSKKYFDDIKNIVSNDNQDIKNFTLT